MCANWGMYCPMRKGGHLAVRTGKPRQRTSGLHRRARKYDLELLLLRSILMAVVLSCRNALSEGRGFVRLIAQLSPGRERTLSFARGQQVR